MAPGCVRFDLARGFDAVHRVHDQVHQHHVGQYIGRAADGITAVRRLTHNLHVRLRLQEVADAAAHDMVVIGDEDANCFTHRGTSASTLVPWPGTLSTVKLAVHLLDPFFHA